MELLFFDDPAVFLEEAAAFLGADPVQATVVSTNAERRIREVGAGVAEELDFPHWWLAVRDGDRIVGAAMRSAPFPPHPAYVLAMPDEAAVMLGDALHERGEELLGLNGALPAARLTAAAYAARVGGIVQVAEHTRIFELGALIEPRPVPGGLRAAVEADLDLALAWFDAFGADAAEQGGRAEAHSAPHVDAAEMRRRIAERRIWLWADEDGDPVHLTGHSLPSFGVARIGPVYTPRDRRGHGYASAAVAAVSRRLLDEGSRVTLFTDQANPVSNRIYTALGYRAVAEQANLRIG